MEMFALFSNINLIFSFFHFQGEKKGACDCVDLLNQADKLPPLTEYHLRFVWQARTLLSLRERDTCC